MKNKVLYLLVSILFTAPLYTIDKATFKVGKNFFDKKLYSEAEKRFMDIVRKYPDSPLYHQSLFYLGNTYAHMGQYKPALQYYKLLLSKSKTISSKQNALLGIAKSWLQLGEHKKAGDFYSFYATEYPESQHAAAALYFAGISRERENDIPAAIEKYRVLMNMYPDSEYQGKAIEKVAVLDNSTPEELWATAETTEEQSEELDLLDIGFEDVDLKAQNSAAMPIMAPQPVSPQVVTQFMQSPATIVTQQIVTPPTVVTQQVQMPPVVVTQTMAPTVITQKIMAPPTVITQQVQMPPTVVTQVAPPVQMPVVEQEEVKEEQKSTSLQDATIIQQKDGVFIPQLSGSEKIRQDELEEYKRLWEEEKRQQEKQEELSQAQHQIKEVIRLAENKAKVLEVREQTLLEEQNKLKNNLYQNLLGIQRVEREQQAYAGLPTYITPSGAAAPVVNTEETTEESTEETTEESSEETSEESGDGMTPEEVEATIETIYEDETVDITEESYDDYADYSGEEYTDEYTEASADDYGYEAYEGEEYEEYAAE